MKLHEQRINICNRCEFSGGWFCKKCGCLLPVKTRQTDNKCPIGKW